MPSTAAAAVGTMATAVQAGAALPSGFAATTVALCDGVAVGNAVDEGGCHRGWFLGSFMPTVGPGALLHAAGVEVKWGVHPAGDARTEWGRADCTSLTVCVRGRFRVIFPDSEVVLSREGDFAVWAPGVVHKWVAEADTVMVTVRWPSASA
jgi:hypothetical protein